MRRFLCTLLLLWGSASVHATPARSVLVLGDSLSAAHNIPVESGWVSLLGSRLSKMEPAWTVVNASISGETSLSGRNRLPALLARERPSLVVIELGANDGLRGLPLDALRANLAAMIDASHRAGAKVLLLGIELPVNYGPQYRDGLRAVYADLARDRHVALVPFLLEGVALDPSLMQDDGLHPTAAGEPLVLENVWTQLQPLLAKAAKRPRKRSDHARREGGSEPVIAEGTDGVSRSGFGPISRPHEISHPADRRRG